MKKTGSFCKFILGLNKGMRWNWFMRFTAAGFLKIAVMGILQTYNISWDSWPYVFSSLLGLFACAVTILYPFFIILLTYFNDHKDKKFIKKFGGVYEAYRKDSKWTLNFTFFAVMRKGLFSFALVYF